MPASSKSLTTVSPAVAAAYVDTDGAALYIASTRSTLETMRSRGEGPRFRRVGRAVRYAIADLDRYMEAQPAGGGRA